MKEGIPMSEVNVNEIAQKLSLTVEQVNSSPAIKDTFNEINNNANLTEDEKNDAFAEMASIFKGMLQK